MTLETFYRDYRDVEGIPQPMKHALTHDGKKFIDMEITQVQFLERIDEAAFAKP